MWNARRRLELIRACLPLCYKYQRIVTYCYTLYLREVWCCEFPTDHRHVGIFENGSCRLQKKNIKRMNANKVGQSETLEAY